MKKTLALFLTTILLCCGCSEKAGHSKAPAFASLMKKSAKYDKPMMIDIYAEWCGPCKRLAAQVFNDKEARQVIDALFIFAQIDGEKGEGPMLKEKYKVRGYPTILILKPDGTEIDRIVGYGNNKESYVQTLKDYAKGKNTLSDLLDQSEHDPANIDLLYKLANKYMDRSDYPSSVFYFEKILKNDPNDTKGFRAEAEFSIASLSIQTEKNPAALEKYLLSCQNREYLFDGYSTLANFYYKAGNPGKAITAYETGLNKLQQNPQYLNSYAWFIFQHKINDYYQRGIEIAGQAVKLAPEEDGIWDTLAQLCYAAGQKEAAIQAMEKAVELAPNESSYINLLKTYKGE